MQAIKNHGVILNEREKFRLQLMDAYEKMEPKSNKGKKRKDRGTKPLRGVFNKLSC